LSRPARAAAEQALAQVADPSLVPGLAQLVRSGDPELQLAGAQALGRSQSAEAVGPLADLLSDSELGPVASRALIALSESFRREVLKALEEKAAERPTPFAIAALARVAGVQAAPVLRKALKHPEPAVRAAAAEASSEAGTDISLELSRLGLSDEVATVRASAARALAKLCEPMAAGLIRIALGDEDANVRRAAIEAAGCCGVDELTSELEKQARSDDPLSATLAIRSLARLQKLTPALLRQAVKHPDAELVKEALAAGAALPDAVDLATQLLSHRRWDVRVTAARVLSSSGGADAVPAIKEALRHESDPTARAAMSGALELLSQR
jgi:HEAT repeat protein